jgi:hypothetical protein
MYIMRHAIDPRQKTLFDVSSSFFSETALKKLQSDWPGLFRAQMLHLMPVDQIGKHFHPNLGCRTKELYSMAGLIFLKESFDLTVEEAVDKYIFDGRYHYALNVTPSQATMGEATYYRYQKIFLKDDAAYAIFEEVTTALLKALDLDIEKQRLDSTHLFSDMATFGRTRLMAVAIKRFLTSLRRHSREEYDSIDREFLSRYAPTQGKLFADWKKKDAKGLRQSVAEDLFFLVERYSDHKEIAGRSTYKAMARILEEQCDIDCGKATVKNKTGGNVMQNPSDEDATYDGHKGPGYQAQICETCSPHNEEQLIVGCIPETACAPDSDAVEPMLDQLEEGDRLPESILADGAYGGDENVEHAEARSVDLQSPVSTTTEDAYALNIDDFVVDENTEEIECCPAGHQPQSSIHDPETGTTRTILNPGDCFGCACQKECPVENIKGTFVINHTAKSRRLASRRREQDTNAFRDHYRIRSGGESVNSGLKRKTGLGRLRRRGMPAVRMSVFLKVAGWNIFRAVSILRKRGIALFCSDTGANDPFFAAFAEIFLRRRTFFHFTSRSVRVCLRPFNFAA